jgi:large repetitive protein
MVAVMVGALVTIPVTGASAADQDVSADPTSSAATAGSTATPTDLPSPSDSETTAPSSSPPAEPSPGQPNPTDSGPSATSSPSDSPAPATTASTTAPAPPMPQIIPETAGRPGPPAKALDDVAATRTGAPVVIPVTRNDTAANGAEVVVTVAPDTGTATANGTRIRYRPPAAFKGTARFSYGLQVAGRLADQAQVTVTVLPPARAVASAIDDLAVTRAGLPVTIPVLYNDVSKGFSVSVETRPRHGAAEATSSEGCEFGCSADSITYTPRPGFVGEDSFRYGLSDPGSETGPGLGPVDTATVRVTVLADPGSEQAKAVNDTLLVGRGGSVTFNPLANDVVPPGWTLALTGSITSRARLDWNPRTSRLTYTPSGSASAGTDRFGYELRPPDPPTATPRRPVELAWREPTLLDLFRGAIDQSSRASLQSALTGSAPAASDLTATVTVLINGPIAVDDVAVTNPSKRVTIPVSRNDSGIDGHCLELAATPRHGTARLDSSTGDVAYTPEPGFAGVDEFGYQRRDSCADASSAATGATVTVTVRKPVARNDSAQTYPGRPVLIDVLANDRSGGLFTLRPGNAQHGDVVAASRAEGPDRLLLYRPRADFAGGTDDFGYELVSTDGSVVGRARVAVQVDPVVAADDTAYTTADEPVTIHVTGNDTLPKGAFVRVVRDGAVGTAVTGEGRGTIDYTPKAGFADVSTDTFEYAIEVPGEEGPGLLGEGRQFPIELARATVTVRRVRAVDDAVTASFGLPVDVDVLGNDVGPDGLDVVLDSTPGPGTVDVQSTSRGVFHLVPQPGFVGTAVFDYALVDGERTVDTGAVTVTVPERPLAIDDAAITDPGAPVVVDVLANDIAATGLEPRIKTQADRGTAVVGPGNRITYTPKPGLAGPDVFTYELLVPGGSLPLTAAAVTITVEPPDAVDDSLRMFSNQFELINVTANDRFAAGFAVRVHQPGHGGTTIGSAGVVRYTPAPGFDGPDHFDYDLVDTLGAVAATGTVQVRVQRVDAVDDTVRIAHSAPPVTIRVLANDTTVNGVTVRLGTVPDPRVGTVTLNSDGRVVFTPGAWFRSGDGFQYALTGVVRGARIDLDRANVVIRLRPAPGGSTPGGSTPGGSTPSGPIPTPGPSPSGGTPAPPPAPIGVRINVGSASPLAPVQVTGSRCPAGTPVQVAVDGSTVATVQADQAGRFAATITAPGRIGRHPLAVTCGAATWTSSLDVVVTTMESATQAPAAAGVLAAALLLFFLLSGLGLNPTGRRARTRRH